MKKNNVKKSIAAMMVVGMTLTGAAGVYAGTNLQTIQAYVNNKISFNVKGSVFEPKDANGKPLAPILYNDTTYLPVRALSEALQAPVSYDNKTGVITIGAPTSGVPGNGNGQTDTWVKPSYTAAQLEAIQKAFAGFDGFETAYAPQLIKKGDALQKIVATDDGVNFIFAQMMVNVSPRDYSAGYTGTEVTLSNGHTGKWYTPSDTAMLTVKQDDRYVTLSSPNGKLSKAELEKIAANVMKVNSSQAGTVQLSELKYTEAQHKAIKAEFAKFDGFKTAYAPMQMAKGDTFQKAAAGGDGVTFRFQHMNVSISPRDYSYEYAGKNVTLSNGVKAKWYTPSDTAMLTFELDDRYVTLSSPDHKLTKAQLEQIALGVAKLK